MLKQFKLFPIILCIHDDGAAPAGTPAPGPGNQEQTGAQVVYGKQEDNAPDAEGKIPEKTPKARKAEFESLISGEYKDEFTARTQDIINRRFKETKGLQERLDALNPVIDTLSAKYGLKDADPKKIVEAFENDSRFFEELADEAGLTVDQYKKMLKMQRENASLRSVQEQIMAQQRNEELRRQEEEMKVMYPNFDLLAEIQGNAEFADMLNRGVNVRAAYNAVHFDELATGMITAAGQRAAANVQKTIQAKGQRPTEAGAASTPGIIVKDDPSKFTREDILAVIEKAKRGETIRF